MIKDEPIALSEIAQRFRPENAEVVAFHESVAKIGEPADFFYAYCMLRGELYSVNVQYAMLPYYMLRTPEFHKDRIFLNRYIRQGRVFHLAERTFLGQGEDPRIVSNGQRAYAIIKANFFSEHEALLCDLSTRKTVPIRVSAPGFQYGKNWQPFFVGDDLYFVHEMTPFRVIKVDVDTGQGEIVREVDLSFNLTCFHSKYPMFRGGGSAIATEENILGVGRATSQRYRHHPFFWSLRRDDHLEIIFTEFFHSFQRVGFNIIDPTSLFIDGNTIFIGLCCTERDWAHTQIVSNMLIRLSAKSLHHCEGALLLDEYLQKWTKVEEKGRPNLGRHIFFCIEMPTSIYSVEEYGGRLSLGEQGHLVHGPYLRITDDDHYRAELSYLTNACPARRAGVFEVVVSHIDKNKRQSDFRTLALINLSGTKGDMAEVSIAFSTRGLLGMFLEFRVFVEEDVQMNAFHIRTWRSEAAEARNWASLPPLPGTTMPTTVTTHVDEA